MSAGARTGVSQPFDPADPSAWIGRGRSADHARAIAHAWQVLPDLAPERPLAERMARTRQRVELLRPLHEQMSAETRAASIAANFRFTENRVATGCGEARDADILDARDRHALGWIEAVRYAEGCHAARAGWPPRRSFRGEEPVIAAAYELGFRSAGGVPEDIFDTARRLYRADRLAADSPPVVRPATRPSISAWPTPTDAPRPVSWPRRLLITGARIWRDEGHMLRVVLEQAGWPGDAIHLIAGAECGFAHLTDGVTDSDLLDSDTIRSLLVAREVEDVLVIADGDDLAFLDAHRMILPIVRTAERCHFTPLLRRSGLRTWLARGRHDGEGLAGGHIRWGKVAAGLTARLGALTARHAGPARPRGHRIIVEDGFGLATGYASAAGDPLIPERVISNRAHLRATMEHMLRSFAGGMVLPVAPQTLQVGSHRAMPVAHEGERKVGSDS